MNALSEKYLKMRASNERWKANNREYYLKQKRMLSARPEYRARMRAKYAEQQQELREAGILPRKMGRPRLYEGEEAIERKRERARLASAVYRSKQKTQVQENNESTSESSSEKSD